MDQAQEAVVETAAPEMTEEGVALLNDYPVNHRLRAEAMARDGLSSDPDGMITPELITDAAERLDAEKAAADAAAREAPSMKWKLDDLRDAASKANPPIAGAESMDKAALVDALTGAQAPNDQEA
jgi:hypothetical protein